MKMQEDGTNYLLHGEIVPNHGSVEKGLSRKSVGIGAQ